jgi:hypothetical protein
MSHIFNLDDLNDDFNEKIDLDELYEKKHKYDLDKLNIFNKLLARIHNKIKLTSRQKVDEQYCWFVVPEIMIGVPKYDHASCIAYLVDKLKNNGFVVHYIHPNVIFISWKHWIPSYVRSEINNKMGVKIDGYGKIINKEKKALPFEKDDINSIVFNNKNDKNDKDKNDKNYKSINDYKPSGNFLYNEDLMNNIQKKFNE